MEIDKVSRTIFDAMREGILIIDMERRIVFSNKAYQDFLRKETGSDIGQIAGGILSELRPGALLPEVLKSGKPILHATRKETQDSYFVNMYPLYQSSELIGGVSVVTFLEDAYRTKETLEAMEARNKQLLRRINKGSGAKYMFDDIVAVSPMATNVKQLAERIASTDATVLLMGESGTGKELYAQAIHNASKRRREVFAAVNCSSFVTNILDSELFGYVEGAFTDAKKGGKMGLFEAANGGTLFLDELSEMDITLQSKLLRALQEQRVRPVGSASEIEVDVRVISACNVDLNQYIKEGKFRSDLYYRLNTVPIHLPPLRECKNDIPALTKSILAQLSHKLHRNLEISDDAMEMLRGHVWPGNVRELRNVLEYSTYLSTDDLISVTAFPSNLTSSHLTSQGHKLAQQVQQFEQEVICRRLQINGDNLPGKKKTAAELGISLATLYTKLKNIPKIRN